MRGAARVTAVVAAWAGVGLAAPLARAQGTGPAVAQKGPVVAARRFYVGVGVPFEGFGFYQQKDNKVTVWNLTPFSVEAQLAGHWGARFSVYTVYSVPQPRTVGEFELNLEFPYYLFGGARNLPLSGAYVGPMAMMQLHDQDTGATLGGPGVTLGYRGGFSDRYWYRIGVYLAYHRYLFGPKEALLAQNGGSESGGLFMGLTLFEVGMAF